MLLFILVWIAFLGISQGNCPVVQKNGNSFYEIEIVEGMTLFSLSKELGVSLNQIKLDNPELTDQIQLGGKILVRATRTDMIHEVSSGETPFGLSKLYVISLDTLYFFNPGIQDGLKVGQKITIKKGIKPLKKAVQSTIDPEPSLDTIPQVFRTFDFKDTVITYVVKPGDKLSEIAKRYLLSTQTLKEENGLKSSAIKAGSLLKIPLKKEDESIGMHTISSVKPNKPIISSIKADVIFSPAKFSGPIKIGVFLPFKLDTLRYPLKGQQKNAIDFFEGILVGLDSISSLGIDGDIYFFDYKSKKERVETLIQSGKLDPFDLFICPFDKTETEKLSEFSAKKQIPIICSSTYASSLIENNEMVFVLPTETSVAITQLAIKLAENNVNELVFMRSGLVSDTLNENLFIRTFNANNSKKGKLIISDKETISALSKSSTSLRIACVSTDKKTVLDVLKKRSLNPLVTLYGLKEWTDLKEVNSTIENRFNFSFLSTSCFNYNFPRTKVFHKAYRARFNADLNKSVAFGYDIINGFVPWYFNSKPFPYQGVMTTMQFNQTVGKYHSNWAMYPCEFVDFKTVINANW